MLVFLDTEFTGLLHPQLLSLGLVTLDTREHYVELDMSTDAGKVRRQACSDFVKHGGVLDLWGLIPGAAGTEWEMGRRTGDWLLQLAEESGSLVEVAFDYSTDYELMEYIVRDARLWDGVREVMIPIDVGALTGSPEGEDAAEECLRELRRRGLSRHHALADAHVLRAAYIAVKAVALTMAAAVHSPQYVRLATHAQQLWFEEAWLRKWLREPAFGLSGRLPMDVIREPHGLQVLEDLLVRIAHGVYS